MIGPKFQVQWIQIPMRQCPFCGKKAELRRFFLGSKSTALRSLWYDSESQSEFFPKKRSMITNRIEIGCFNRICFVLPKIEYLYNGDPDDYYETDQIIIKLKNNWNKRTKRKEKFL